MESIKRFEPLFGEWYAIERIGEGSFGKVYKVCKEELGNKYFAAVKHMQIPSSTDETDSLRSDGMDDASISDYYTTLAKDVVAETRIMDSLKGHTNIVSFEASNVIAKQPGPGYDIFIRMELLRSLLAETASRKLSRSEVVKLGKDICTALEVCEKSGIIHRDIKPANIFINKHGDYKLGDFGIARQLEKTSGYMSKKGTYNYMAPEVYKGEEYGTSCDIYSLGIVMYRLLNNGRLPFFPPSDRPVTPSDSENALARRMRGDAMPLPCEANDALGRVIVRACAYHPRDRFTSAREMRGALEAAEARGTVPPKTVPQSKGDGANEKTQGVMPGITAQPPAGQGYARNPINTPQTNPAPQRYAPGPVNPPQTNPAPQRYAPAPVNPPQMNPAPQRYAPGPMNPPQANPAPTGYGAPVMARKKKTGWLIAAIALILAMAVGAVLLISSGKLNTGAGRSNSETEANPEVVFSDPVFEQEFRSGFGFEGPIYTSDIMRIDSLTIYADGADNIEDLRKFKNLTWLWIDAAGISDIRALASLTNLETLKLNGNGISDLSSLSGLVNLKTLDLSNNNISDVSALSDLTGLEELDLSGNAITSVRPLSGLINLEILYIEKNGISDVSPLAGLTRLEGLDLSDNALTDVRTLAGLRQLKYLYLRNNPIGNIGAVSGMSELSVLDIHGTKVSDTSPIHGLRNLEALEIGYTGVRNIDFLSGLKKLEWLEMSNLGLTDITVLSELTALTVLYLYSNEIADIGPLANLTELEDLDIDDNYIEDLSALGRLSKLTELDASSNLFADIGVLAGLTELKKLYLSYNYISDLSPLYGLAKLEELDLSGDVLLSQAEIDALGSRLPNCSITR